jgi:hypothetical protein
LQRIAERVVMMALDGDKDGISEIGNRLDGKARQQIDAEVGTTFHIHWSLPPYPLERAQPLGPGHARWRSSVQFGHGFP